MPAPNRRPTEPRGVAKPIGILLKLGVSLGLLLTVVGGDVGELRIALAPARADLLVLAVATHGIGLALCAARWRLLMRVQAIVLSFRETLLIYWVGCFFNFCLPTGVGGDVAKGYLVARRKGQAVEAFTTVVVERVIGLLTLLIIAAAGALWILLGAGGHGRWATIGPLGIAIGNELWRGRFREALARGRVAAGRYRRHRREFVGVCTLSLLVQANVVGCYLLVARALGITGVPVAYFCLLIPAVLVTTMLPVSVGGVGVREAAFVAFFSPLGVSAPQLIALSLWSSALMLVVALGGGAVYSLSRLGAPPSRAWGSVAEVSTPDDGR